MPNEIIEADGWITIHFDPPIEVTIDGKITESDRISIRKIEDE